MPTSVSSDLNEIVSAVSSSKKYRTVCEDTVRHIAEHESTRHGSLKAATKATKRRLHQVYGAFGQSFEYDSGLLLLEEAYATGLDDRIMAACRRILSAHSFTRERL
jgi:16S rRNA (guanine(1405)-N(7))-methyltransferase